MVTLTPPLTFLPTDRAPTGGTFTDCSLYRNSTNNNTLAAGCHLSAWLGDGEESDSVLPQAAIVKKPRN